MGPTSNSHARTQSPNTHFSSHAYLHQVTKMTSEQNQQLSCAQDLLGVFCMFWVRMAQTLATLSLAKLQSKVFAE